MTRIVPCTSLLIVLLLFDSLAGGAILNRTAKPLSSRDCYRIGVEAQKSRNYGLAIEWLEMALKSPDDAEFKSDVIVELAETHYLVGNTMTSFFYGHPNTAITHTQRVPIHSKHIV